MKKFKVKIHVGDFTTSTVEDAETKNDAIKSFVGRYTFKQFEENEMRIICEELPKLSAFQEWEKDQKIRAVRIHDIRTGGTTVAVEVKKCRKEGWNAAIDEVIRLCFSIPGFPGGEIFKKIMQLNEEK